VSPAIVPSYNDVYQFLDPPNEQYFTPLSSPALLPNVDSSNTDIPSTHVNSLQDPAVLAQQLAQIEAKQLKLREQMKLSPVVSPTYRKSPLAMFSNRLQAPPSPLPFSNNNKKRPSLRQKIALASPQLHSTQNHHINLPTTPATPGSLMKMSHHLSQMPLSSPTQERELVDIMPSLPPSAIESPSTFKKRKLAPSSPITTSSPRSLKPLISPFLQPDLRNSNLISQIQTPGIENRRSAHKVAEQKRRDTLKQSFDSLRKEIIDVLVKDSDKRNEKTVREEKEKEVKLMSKVLLLQHSYEYIVRLKTDSRLKDDKISNMQKEIDRLKELTQKIKE
jgi:hypothetical protein